MGERIEPGCSCHALGCGHSKGVIHHCHIGQQHITLQQHLYAMHGVGHDGELCHLRACSRRGRDSHHLRHLAINHTAVVVGNRAFTHSHCSNSLRRVERTSATYAYAEVASSIAIHAHSGSNHHVGWLAGDSIENHMFHLMCIEHLT